MIMAIIIIIINFLNDLIKMYYYRFQNHHLHINNYHHFIIFNYKIIIYIFTLIDTVNYLSINFYLKMMIPQNHNYNHPLYFYF